MELFKTRSTFFLMVIICLHGCMRAPATAEERRRAREVLEETSPRNLNDLPKAVQEFKYTI